MNKIIFSLIILSISIPVLANDSTKIKALYAQMDVALRQRIEQNSSVNSDSANYIVDLTGVQKPIHTNVKEMYRRPSDQSIWDYSKLSGVDEYLEKLNTASNSAINFYVVFAAVYKDLDVDDDPRIEYTYEKLSETYKEKANQVASLNSSTSWGSSYIANDASYRYEKFNRFTNKGYPLYSGSAKPFIAIYVISNFVPSKSGGVKGKLFHTFGFHHSNVSEELLETIMSPFAVDSWFNLMNTKEDNLNYLLKTAYTYYTNPSLAPKSHVSLKKELKCSGPFFEGMKTKIGNQYKPNATPPSAPNPNLYDYCNALTQAQIQDALTVFNEIKSNQELGFTVKTFITDFTVPRNVIEEIRTYTKNLGAKDIIQWIHFNDTKSPPRIEFFYGSGVPKPRNLNFLEDAFVSLFDWGLEVNPLKAILEGLVYMIGKAHIPPKFYNPAVSNYNPVISKVYGYFRINNPIIQGAFTLIPGFPSLNNNYTAARAEVAMYIGFWNGLVDMVQGIPEFLDFIVDMACDKEKRDQFVEGWGKMKEKGIFNTLKGAFLDQYPATGSNFNACYWAHSIGHNVFDLLSLVIAFAKVGTAAKIAQLMDAIDPMAHMCKFIFKRLSTVTGWVVDGTKQIYKLGNGYIQTFFEQGQIIFRVVSQAGELINEQLNWLHAISATTIDGRTVSVLIDPAQKPSFIARVVEVYKDEQGKFLKDKYGNGLAKIRNESSGEEMLGIVRSVDDVSAILAKINAIRTKFPQLAAKLDAITDDALRARFLDDFEGNDVLLGKFNSNAISFDAWEVLGSRSTLRTMASYLEKITAILNNPKFQQLFGAGYKADLTTICQINGDVSFWGKKGLDFHLEQLEKYCNKFANIPGAEGIRSMAVNASASMQDGLWHSLKELNLLDPQYVSRFDLQFENSSGFICPPPYCRFDVELIGGELKYIEFKSVKDISSISINQFKSYLSRINTLKEMSYIFNLSKTTTEQAKEIMKQVLKNNADNIFKELSEGGIGLTKCQSLFETTNSAIFKSRLDDPKYLEKYLQFVKSN
jgi:hypothetical protein